jgi:hypothetical protein
VLLHRDPTPTIKDDLDGHGVVHDAVGVQEARSMTSKVIEQSSVCDVGSKDEGCEEHLPDFFFFLLCKLRSKDEGCKARTLYTRK